MTMNIKTILADAGVVVTDEVADLLASKLEIKKEKKTQHKKWVAVDEVEFTAKTPLQMRQAVLAIQGEGEVDTEKWSNLLATYPGFKTQQPVDRIIAFYRKRMLDEGLIQAAD